VECPRCHKGNNQNSRYCASCGTVLPGEPPAGGTLTFFPPPDAFATGSLFAGRYRIIEEIGQGGMGKVYKAFDAKVQEKIALKIIRPEIAQDRTAVERFRNELKLARQITHPHVCRVFDLGEDAGTSFLTMEYVPGENLARMIRITGPLAPETSVGYARQIAEGLAAAHRLGVIHRDLKPHNILIDESGAAKIMDFGLARSVQTEGVTGDGRPMGTPEYMSPEQVDGQPADERSDIYAFGLVLYEMVTGKRPFTGDSPLSLALKHKTSSPQPPGELNPSIPAELEALILQCLAKDKAKRPQQAGELLAKLDAIRFRTSKTPRSAARTSSMVSGRPRRILARRAATILPGVILLTALGYILFHKSPAGTRPDPDASSSPAAPVLKNSIAILPFEIVSLDPNLSVLWKGLADDIRTQLKIIGDLNVISGFSSEQFAATRKEPGRIATLLNVEKYLEGTILIEKTVIRINVSLIDAQTTGLLPWTKSYEHKVGDSFSQVRDKIAGDIAAQLNRPFNPAELQRLRKRDTENVDAYILVHGAQALQISYRDTRRVEEFQAALTLYQKAAGFDPNYLKTYLGLGNLYESRYIQTKKQEDLAAMIHYFQTAAVKDDMNAEVHAGLGWAAFHREDFGGAYSHFKKALALAPNTAEAYFNAGSFLRSIGLYGNAIKSYARAIELDPLNFPYYLGASSCYWYVGDYESGLRLIRKALNLEPKSPRVHLAYARILILMKDFGEAERELRLLESLTPIAPETRTAIDRRRALYLAAKGDRDGALALLRNDKDPYLLEATSAYSILGLKDEAILNIKKGHDEGFYLIQDYLYGYPFLINNRYFDGLRDDSRFQAIVEAERAVYESKMRKYGDL
jgi:serine/threonine protein kinase/Flp pilus assembly protein TadD